MPTASEYMQLLKDAIHNKLIPIKYERNNVELELVTLPVHYGGMPLDDPVTTVWRQIFEAHNFRFFSRIGIEP